MTFTGTPEALRARLAKLEAAGATGIIFGTSGTDVERELHAFARCFWRHTGAKSLGPANVWPRQPVDFW